jgi:transcriptional regulator with XRE-family HTH domain
MPSNILSSQLSKIEIPIIVNSMKPSVDELNRLRGDNLARLRKARGWTQLDLAKKLGWDPLEKSKISAYENGLSFGKDIEVRLCEIFGVHYSEFSQPRNPPYPTSEQEQMIIDLFRQTEGLGATREEAVRYLKFIVEDGKKKEGPGDEGTKGGVPRAGRKRK